MSIRIVQRIEEQILYVSILIISRVGNTKIYLSERCSWKLNRATKIFPSHGLIPQLFKLLFCTWLQILQTLPGSISLHLQLSASEARWKRWVRAPAGCSWQFGEGNSATRICTSQGSNPYLMHVPNSCLIAKGFLSLKQQNFPKFTLLFISSQWRVLWATCYKPTGL